MIKNLKSILKKFEILALIFDNYYTVISTTYFN